MGKKVNEQFDKVVDITRKAQAITSITELAGLVYMMHEQHMENQVKIISELKSLRRLIETRVPKPPKS